MDRSKEYINQCEKAEKIQELWEPKVGDVFAHIHPEGLRIVETNPVYKAGAGHTIAGEGDLLPLALNWSKRQERYIWLPRQDKLQEMLKLSPLPLIILFSAYVRDVPVYGMEWSMEQLWLAFVMKEKYNKKWNGEEWIDN